MASDSHNDVRSGERNRATMLAAPGVEILTTIPRHAYAFLSGTSLAAAHVSGVVALLLEREPMMSPSQVRLVLFATARPVTASGVRRFGWSMRVPRWPGSSEAMRRRVTS